MSSVRVGDLDKIQELVRREVKLSTHSSVVVFSYHTVYLSLVVHFSVAFMSGMADRGDFPSISDGPPYFQCICRIVKTGDTSIAWNTLAFHKITAVPFKMYMAMNTAVSNLVYIKIKCCN